MKIKRTKTGTKTSDSKHEIVKSEQNGNLNSDDAVSTINCKKQPNPIGVPASPSSSATKRGNSSHRKEKTKEKLTSKEKSENPLQQENICHCSTDKTSSVSCGSVNCIKHREAGTPSRNSSSHSQMPMR